MHGRYDRQAGPDRSYDSVLPTPVSPRRERGFSRADLFDESLTQDASNKRNTNLITHFSSVGIKLQEREEFHVALSRK